MSATHWHLLSGEYPPRLGGVADYTRQVARALAARGEQVHVWAPSVSGDGPEDPGVTVHRVSGLGPRALRSIDDQLRSMEGPRRWFVQYVPTGLGLRGMNVPLVQWLRARHDEIWVQFHEVVLGWQLWRKPQLHLMHAVQLWMAAALARRADRLFVSIEGWRPRLGSEASRAEWLPIPSNIPVTVSPSDVALVRGELGPGPWIGHFGTYAGGVTRDLVPSLAEILRRRPEVRVLLLGRGEERVAQALPRGRVLATGMLPGEAVAARLAAVDLALQPFPDGISTRRTSAMAALALGIPVVTTDGHLTDSLWRDGAVALGPAGDPVRLAGLCLELLDDTEQRAHLGRSGARLYAKSFSLEHTVETLRSDHGARLVATS